MTNTFQSNMLSFLSKPWWWYNPVSIWELGAKFSIFEINFEILIKFKKVKATCMNFKIVCPEI